MSLGVGKEIVSHCNKCKLNLAHTIVTMKDEQTLGKVECKTCQARHAYKDPSAVKMSKIKKSANKKSNSKKATKESISDLWMRMISTSKTKSQDYSPKLQFVTGDIIDHKKFGPGFIEKLIDADKIQVIFRHDIKTLIHNR